MASIFSDFQQNKSSHRTDEKRLVCYLLVKSNSTLLLMETRIPTSGHMQCTRTVHIGGITYCMHPLVCPCTSSTRNGCTGKSSEPNTDHPSVVDSVTVPINITSSHRKTTQYRETGNTSKKSSRGGSPSSSQKLRHLGDKDLLKLGISRASASLIINA